jgi:hypothetical protein
MLMLAVMIGVDPHKGSHTAVVIGAAEEQLGEIRVRASARTGTPRRLSAAWRTSLCGIPITPSSTARRRTRGRFWTVIRTPPCGPSS